MVLRVKVPDAHSDCPLGEKFGAVEEICSQLVSVPVSSVVVRRPSLQGWCIFLVAYSVASSLVAEQLPVTQQLNPCCRAGVCWVVIGALDATSCAAEAVVWHKRRFTAH